MTVTPFRRPQETAADAVKRMETETRIVAARVAQDLNRDLAEIKAELVGASTMSSLPPGVRDTYRRLAEQIEAGLNTITAVSGR